MKPEKITRYWSQVADTPQSIVKRTAMVWAARKRARERYVTLDEMFSDMASMIAADIIKDMSNEEINTALRWFNEQEQVKKAGSN